MDLETFRGYCLKLKGVTESTPFDDKTLAFKVMDKIFALTDMDSFQSINLKCDPEEAVLLREQYEAVSAGYHMNKKHWNTVLSNGDMNDKTILQWTLHSYELVVKGLTKKQKEILMNL